MSVNNPNSRLRAASLEGLAGEFFGFVYAGDYEGQAGNPKNSAVIDSQVVIGIKLEADEGCEVFRKRAKAL